MKEDFTQLGKVKNVFCLLYEAYRIITGLYTCFDVQLFSCKPGTANQHFQKVANNESFHTSLKTESL